METTTPPAVPPTVATDAAPVCQWCGVTVWAPRSRVCVITVRGQSGEFHRHYCEATTLMVSGSLWGSWGTDTERTTSPTVKPPAW